MKTLLSFIRESNIPYGEVVPQFKNKIDMNNPILKHFISTGLIQKYYDMKPPTDENSVSEIIHLKDIMKNASEEEIQFALSAEVDEELCYKTFAQSIGITVPNDFVTKIMDQTDPILYFLKDHFNRARPEQVANSFNIQFQVKIPNTAMNPAYPSGHALDSHIMAYCIKKLAPHKSEEIEQFAKKMRDSRMNVGLHYPSDNIISKILANDIIASGLLRIPEIQ